MNELVSVIIPSYGGGAFLQRTVDSILAQTYPHVEAVVVDDNGVGTPAQLETAKQMEKYAGMDNVRYVCHEVNKNGSAARNTGVRNARGAYIALLDDDDIFLPDNIRTQLEVLQSLGEDYALTYCSNEVYRGDEKLWEYHVSQSGSLLYEVLMHTVTIGSSALLIRRSVYEALGGFDESFRRHQDWEFTARVAANYKVHAIDRIGYRRYLEFRNSPKSVEKAKQLRLYYLEKMEPYLAMLTKKQRRNVIVTNRMDIAVQYIKQKQFGKFLRECWQIRPGISGLVAFVRQRYAYSKCRVKQKH